MKLGWNSNYTLPVLELSTLGCSNTNNKTLQVYRESFGPAPPKTDSDANYYIIDAVEVGMNLGWNSNYTLHLN